MFELIKEVLKGKCAKQNTIAIIVNNGSYFIGSNWCDDPQDDCPRGNMKSGEGYHLCKEVCKQKYHAEVDAVKKAGNNAKGGTLFLIGHYYMCDPCKKVVDEAGIEKVVIVDNLIVK